MSRKAYFLLLFLLLAAFLGCQWKLKSAEKQQQRESLKIERYDQTEILYLTTGDFGALKQMTTEYSAMTMTLVEDVLRLGRLDEPGINDRFFEFYQDSTLQTLLHDVQVAYDNMDDINDELDQAFVRLHEMFPHLKTPRVYTQVSALDQSIIVGNGMLAISLDKYMGENYPLYVHFGYTEQQRRMMTRSYIVPDCIAFYLLSVFPSEVEPAHKPRLQYVVNQVVNRKVFDDEQITRVEQYMNHHKELKPEQLLTDSIHII